MILTGSKKKLILTLYYFSANFSVRKQSTALLDAVRTKQKVKAAYQRFGFMQR